MTKWKKKQGEGKEKWEERGEMNGKVKTKEAKQREETRASNIQILNAWQIWFANLTHVQSMSIPVIIIFWLYMHMEVAYNQNPSSLNSTRREQDHHTSCKKGIPQLKWMQIAQDCLGLLHNTVQQNLEKATTPTTKKEPESNWGS